MLQEERAPTRSGERSGDAFAAWILYDTHGRLLQDAVHTYTYDGEGRRSTRTVRASGATETYDWDGLGQLQTVTESDGAQWRYLYDGLGRRVRVERQDASGTVVYGEWFAYDRDDLVTASYTDDGLLSASYVVAPSFGHVLSRTKAGQTEYAVRDGVQTPVAWCTADGSTCTEVERSAFGERMVAPESVEPYGFGGHAEDPNGLVWGRARYLDPSLGMCSPKTRCRPEPSPHSASRSRSRLNA